MHAQGRSEPLSPPLEVSQILARLRDYWTLTKPGIAATVVMTSLAGFFLALRHTGAALNLALLFHTLFGTSLVGTGAGALNMLLESEEDSIMSRTRNRPIPARRIHPEEAFIFGIVLSSLGVVHLAASVNLRAAFFAAMSLVLYLVFYTPLKKISPWCTVVGGVAGALPPIIGWSAISPMKWEVLPIFAIFFIWQFPHLFALAWLFREDYAAAGFKMAPVPDATGRLTARFALLFSILLLPASLLPYFMGICGEFYFWIALLSGLGLFAFTLEFWKQRTSKSAMNLFLFTIIYAPALVAGMIFRR